MWKVPYLSYAYLPVINNRTSRKLKLTQQAQLFSVAHRKVEKASIRSRLMYAIRMKGSGRVQKLSMGRQNVSYFLSAGIHSG